VLDIDNWKGWNLSKAIDRMGEKMETMARLLRGNRFISVQDKVRVIEGAILPGVMYGMEMTLNMTEGRIRAIDS